MLPLYIFSFVVNSLWYQDIAEQAHALYSYSRKEEEKSMTKILHRVKEIQRPNPHQIHQQHRKI